MVDCTPEIVRLDIALHEDLIQVPPALRIVPMILNMLLSDLRGKHGTEPVPQGTHRLVTDVDPAFMKKVLELPQRQRKVDVHHHCKPDDLGRRLEVAEWIGHALKGKAAPTHAQARFSDTATRRDVLPTGSREYRNGCQSGEYRRNIHLRQMSRTPFLIFSLYVVAETINFW